MASKAESGKKYLSHTLAEWACGLKFEHLSEKAIHTAKLFWYDSLGCALGGSQQEDARILLEHYREMSGATEPGRPLPGVSGTGNGFRSVHVFRDLPASTSADGSRRARAGRGG